MKILQVKSHLLTKTNNHLPNNRQEQVKIKHEPAYDSVFFNGKTPVKEIAASDLPKEVIVHILADVIKLLNAPKLDTVPINHCMLDAVNLNFDPNGIDNINFHPNFFKPPKIQAR